MNLTFVYSGSYIAKGVFYTIDIRRQASEVMSLKATGEKLPKGLKNAIKTGKKTTIKVGLSSVEVVREDWHTGKGYEIKVLIK